MPIYDLHPYSSKAEARREFRLYYSDLYDEAEREGWTPDAEETAWEEWLQQSIAIDNLPECAREWTLTD